MGKIFNNKKQNNLRRKLRNEMPKAEVLLWSELKGKKLYGFKLRRQYSIGIYVIDFYCTEKKLAIEIDGPTHFTDDDVENDKLRQNEMEKLGIKFIRFTNDDIYGNISYVIEKIYEELTKC